MRCLLCYTRLGEVCTVRSLAVSFLGLPAWTHPAAAFEKAATMLCLQLRGMLFSRCFDALSVVATGGITHRVD
jgi:hypothetical protein